MHRHYLATLLAAAMATGATAQTHDASHNPAVKDPAAHTTTVAAKGRNSFTEAQARGRIAKAGYTDVGKLAKDRDGIWRGTATRAGAKVDVALDFKGNVTTR